MPLSEVSSDANLPEKPGLSPTFEELAALEPRMNDLLAEAGDCHDVPDPYFCRNAIWHGFVGIHPGMRKRLAALVGPESGRDGLLGTAEAYTAASEALVQVLPFCRHRGECTFHVTLTGEDTPSGVRNVDVKLSSLPQEALAGMGDPDEDVTVYLADSPWITMTWRSLRNVMPDGCRPEAQM
jgi:hypothetical protein